MKTRILSVLITTALIISLTACSEKSEINSKNNGVPITSTTIETVKRPETSNEAEKTIVEGTTEKTNKVNPVESEKPKETEKDKETIAETTSAKPNNRVKSADYPLDLKQSPIYENVEFNETPGYSGIYSYETLAEYLKIDNSLNLVKYEITYMYTEKEALSIADEELKQLLNGKTLYKARIVYDYLNEKNIDIEINILKAGNSTVRWSGSPIYMVGDSYISYIFNLDEFLNKKTLWSMADGQLSFAFHKIKDKEFAYYINEDKIKFINNGVDLNIGVLDSEKSVVTSTRNNPVNYTQKFLVDELTDFIRKDWKEREFNAFDLKKYDGFKLK